MFTPIDLQSKSFKTGMGYSKQDVDSFFQALTSDYEALYRKNLELEDKVNILNDGINHYKSIEKSLQKALVLAEQTAEETINSAKTNATVIEQEAVLKAQSIVADAKIELDHIHAKTLELLKQYETYRTKYHALAQAQAELLSSEAFDIEVESLEAFHKLQETASENYGAINSKPVYQDASPVQMVHPDEEEDMDETLDADDHMHISDLASIFESEED